MGRKATNIIPEKHFYVTMTDLESLRLSKQKNKIHKFVVGCDNKSQQDIIFNRAKKIQMITGGLRNRFKNVRRRCTRPNFNKRTYRVHYKHYSKLDKRIWK
jgi:hypothetical protein